MALKMMLFIISTVIKVTNRFVGAVSNAERGQPRFGLHVLIVFIPDELCADFDGCRRASVWRHQNVANGQAGLEVTSLEREVGDERQDESFFLFLALSQRSQQFDQLDDLTNVLVCLDEKKIFEILFFYKIVLSLQIEGEKKFHFNIYF